MLVLYDRLQKIEEQIDSSQVQQKIKLINEQEQYEKIKSELCKNGRKGVLNIFRNRKKREIGVLWSGRNGDIEILNIWKEYHQRLKSNKEYISSDLVEEMWQFMIEEEQIGSLEWWYQNFRKEILMNSTQIQKEACIKGCIIGLDWCRSKQDMIWHKESLDQVYQCKNLQIVLDWWYENRDWTSLDYSKNVIDNMCLNDDYQNLYWWDCIKEENVQIKYSEKSIENACKMGNVQVLQWWFESKNQMELKYDNKALEQACKNKKEKVIQWWIKKKLDLQMKYDHNNIYVKPYNNILSQKEYKQSINKNSDICQICHEQLYQKYVYECKQCTKEIHKKCYEELKEQNIKFCSNCKSRLFI